MFQTEEDDERHGTALAEPTDDDILRRDLRQLLGEQLSNGQRGLRETPKLRFSPIFRVGQACDVVPLREHRPPEGGGPAAFRRWEDPTGSRQQLWQCLASRGPPGLEELRTELLAVGA